MENSKEMLAFSLLLLSSICFGVGVAQDYPPYVEMLEGQQATYAIRVLNTLNETVFFSIEPVSGMGLVTVIDAAPSYELGPKSKKEIRFLVVAPEGSAGRYEPVFIVNESKKDNSETFVDTSISPQVSFNIKVLPRAHENESGQPAQNAGIPPQQPPEPAQAAADSAMLFAGALIALIILAAAALFLARKKTAKAPGEHARHGARHRPRKSAKKR